ncbi:hypothetical protein N0V93_008585 [Gnomoniopsis smithogilvyi]|uniref:THUMP domain-containing protein n=1 Tax=Gnomoniopsis smithogilvyi TaxID=1191159 RepID=A0A9W8YM97_9PEZI|nr:hypothetical protein N0V93_008585 [Gnomoniopsis smithogilvyi]
MADPVKRKAVDDVDNGWKKKKKGNSGKWKVPRSEGPARPKANAIEPGDIGIWVTCALHMKGKAAREMEILFDDYAEKFYDISSGDDAAVATDEDEGDIESAIQKEVGNLRDKDVSKSDRVFTEVRINQECLLFMKCRAPIEPVDFCRRICQDVLTPGQTGVRARYLNRLTPVSVIVKATETGLEEGARQALVDHFKLKPKVASASADSGPQDGLVKAKEGVEVDEKFATFAIRPSIRNHSSLKRDDVIKSIANLVDPQHKVNLGAPEKVILVDIYQTVCGISVVPGDWEHLKRYNLTELYKQTSSSGEAPAKKKEEGDKEKPGQKSEGQADE